MIVAASCGLRLLAPLGCAPRPRRRAGRAGGAGVSLGMAAFLDSQVPPFPGMLVAYGRYAADVGRSRRRHLLRRRRPARVGRRVATAGGVLNYHNAGKVQASSQPQDMRLQRMLGHLTTLVPDDPKSVLVIGCGAGVTAGAVSIDPEVERETIAEIEPLVPEVVSTLFRRRRITTSSAIRRSACTSTMRGTTW